MPLFNENTLIINDCTVVWDGVTRPNTDDKGRQKWSCKVVINPTNPDLALLQQLADRELQQSEFRGVLPANGLMPIGTAGPTEFNGEFPGWAVVNASTFKTPQVFDENGQALDPMAYGPLMYQGQCVRLLVHCHAYNQVSKGVAARLDGLQIVASANRPQKQYSGGGVDAAAAFGGGAAPAPQQAPIMPPPAPAPAPAPPPAPAPQQAPIMPPPAPQYEVQGVRYTAEQLRQAGYSEEQIAACIVL